MDGTDRATQGYTILVAIFDHEMANSSYSSAGVTVYLADDPNLSPAEQHRVSGYGFTLDDAVRDALKWLRSDGRTPTRPR